MISNSNTFIVGEGVYSPSDFPKMSVFVKVKVNFKSDRYLPKNLEKFMNDIDESDIICLEYPLFYTKNSTYGTRTFSICITNLRNNKSVSVMSTRLDYFWTNLDSFVILNDNF